MSGRGPGETVGKRELKLGVVELSHSSAVALSRRDLLHVTDVNLPETNTVARSEVQVHLADSSAPGGVPVLLGAVVDTGAGLVGEPDDEVLDGIVPLLLDLKGEKRERERGREKEGERKREREER